MNADSQFLVPGADGELAPGTSLWRKGLVYTTRPDPSGRFSGDDYRISAGFKKGVSSAHAAAGFHDVYRRVVTVARLPNFAVGLPRYRRGPEQYHLRSYVAPACGEHRHVFDHLCLRCSVQYGIEATGEPQPTEDALWSPGGATLEELERLAPQRADEIYNEFDFTDPSTPDPGPITLSYGESISGSNPTLDFRPFVERAERVARCYHGAAADVGRSKCPLIPNSASRVGSRQPVLCDRPHLLRSILTAKGPRHRTATRSSGGKSRGLIMPVALK